MAGRTAPRASGRRVLITTTTRMFMPTSHWPVVFCRRSRHASSCVSYIPHFILFSQLESKPGKVQGFTPEAIDALVQRPGV
ncbi:hypothetical protein ACLK1T_18485 [Escherichia coli]